MDRKGTRDTHNLVTVGFAMGTVGSVLVGIGLVEEGGRAMESSVSNVW